MPSLNELTEKEQRLQDQLNEINEKKDISLTRARMLEIAQERNIFARKLFYTLISLILFIVILTLVIYSYKPVIKAINKNMM
jgi:hypothetical protein